MKKTRFFAIALVALSLIGCEKEGGYTAEPEAISPLQTTNFIGVTSYTAIVAGQVNVSISETQDTLGIMYSDDKDLLLNDNRNAYDPRRIDSSDTRHHQMLAQSGVYW